MAKRRAAEASDDEDNYASSSTSPVSKRARTNDVEEEQRTAHRATRDKGKGRQTEPESDAESNDEEDDEEEDNVRPPEVKEEDEQRFMEGYEEAIRASLEAKRKVQGGVAEHGIIEAIEMHQFMCHKYLAFTFGPQINFIIGHNGSGKSAVLSAITVALGGKTASTGRGSGLKSFIREGESVAEVSISIKNQGEEAFKPQEYGKSIIITRRFTKEGSSTWKIKSKDNRTISTKKEELAAICDHMNIQVDNPMNVLTQDAARQFLSASHPSDKYKFFLKGTQLSQLSDEYDLCFENIKSTQRILVQKKTALPDLRSAFKDASVRFEEAKRAREQKKKADELKRELAWGHVKGKEDDLAVKVEEAAKLQRRLPKIQDNIDAAEAKFQKATEDIAAFEQEYRDLGDMENLTQRKENIQTQIRDNKNILADIKRDERAMNQSLQATNRQIQEYTKHIEEETQKAAASSRAKQHATEQRLQEAKEAVDAAESAKEELMSGKRDAQERANTLRQEGIRLDGEKNGIQTKITECQGFIERAAQQTRNALNVFGNNITQVVERVRKSQWRGDVPLGPLGVGVKVRPDANWAAHVLRSQLGRYLTAWAVTNAADLPVLKKMLAENGNPHVLVFVIEKDLFDYSAGEPPAEFLTVLRALEIPDPYVLRILINQARIESTLLAPEFKDAQSLLSRLPGGTVWTSNNLRIVKFQDGGGTTSPMGGLHANDPANLLLTGRDAAAETTHWKDLMKQHEIEYQELTARISRTRNEWTEARRALDAITQREQATMNALRKAKLVHENLQQAANDDMPADVARYQAALNEAVAEKESIVAQFEDVARRQADIDQAQRPLIAQLEEVRREIDEFEGRRNVVSQKIEDTATVRLEAQNHVKHYKAKYDEEKVKVDAADEAVRVLQDEFLAWTEGAEKYCDRVENPRPVAEIQRNLDAVQKALKERERRHGASVEEMTVEVNKARAKLEEVEKDLKSMAVLTKTLKQSLTSRLSRWQEFRRHIALRCKVNFQYNLSHRGYFGKVLFDHNQSILSIKVKTDDQTGTQARDKDPRSLSGGEKSFSTICLLLSLWESIGCPLRCLDEFDVFMDAVNRRISMRMMIDTANSSDKKQYILITPQDMGNIHIGPTVRVHRMTDPERGQDLALAS
ncbi:hypothetical protein HGRIS_005984 [Hohenbuehelia grisea]|uniref:RecF/RecN/SMC N-terminal domain-containing protein n=1 Tax=Hohenbuehelia grisea TaxID=104357 RepID=A0ABR3JZL0_9AGAR